LPANTEGEARVNKFTTRAPPSNFRHYSPAAYYRKPSPAIGRQATAALGTALGK
jgi:hypothetical protein